jgi:hypothetical protein
MNVKLGQLRRWKDGAFKGGLFLVLEITERTLLINEYGSIRQISVHAANASEIVGDESD